MEADVAKLKVLDMNSSKHMFPRLKFLKSILKKFKSLYAFCNDNVKECYDIKMSNKRPKRVRKKKICKNKFCSSQRKSMKSRRMIRESNLSTVSWKRWSMATARVTSVSTR